MKKIFLFFFAAAALNSCIYPFEADLSYQSEDRIVIDGDILIGEQTQIRVSRVSPLSGILDSDRLYPEVSVSVEQRDGAVISATAMGSGTYTVDTEDLDPEGFYRVRVLSKESGKNYVSPWQQAVLPPVISSMYEKVGGESVEMCAGIDGASSSGYYRMEFEETWEYSADFRPDWMFEMVSDVADSSSTDPEDPEKIYRAPYPEENYYYCWSSARNTMYNLVTTQGLSSEVVDKICYTTIPRTSRKLQIMYSSLLTLRSISADAYSYYDNLQKNSTASGSLFSPVPSEVRGNLRCESDTAEFVVGYVSVCRRVQKRFILDCQKQALYKTLRNPEDDLFLPVVDEDGKYNFSSLYSGGQRPVYTTPVRDDAPTKTNMYWAPTRCTDCRASGGTKTKPSYWPNDHE